MMTVKQAIGLLQIRKNDPNVMQLLVRFDEIFLLEFILNCLEKNGGCNHLICKNQSCKYEFCWVCLSAWEPHGSSWYNCNRFNEDDAKKARDDQERSRAALQRYLHYYKRYHNHHESLKFESKLLAEVQKRMESMQQQMSWIEVQFLQMACDVLRQCRQTLMYTYPFAFYLKRNNHS
jgi:ariadne-1